MAEIKITEKKYITGQHEVEVSFLLPYHDWLKLEMSENWANVIQLIHEIGNINIQK